jgi:dGTPase
MLTREEIEREEESRLASYAMKSRDSRGRIYPEPEHPYRSVYQRDRDRIIHSTAFRRLEYKTQVFVIHEGDYYRTRLTHTLEVAQIARSIAKALRLNEELVEAIALAHDLGHTPFGHSGEEALNELMRNHGGFDHNLQGLRVVDFLEIRYPDFKGLNLSWEVREGIVKHSTAFDKFHLVSNLAPEELPTLETQIVDVADEIAYDNHDLDDGITSGMIKEEQLADLEFWRQASKEIESRFSSISRIQRKYQVIRYLINAQISDLIDESEKKIREHNIKTADDVRKLKFKIITFSPEIEKKRQSLRKFLSENLYKHYRVMRMADKARRFIYELFKVYITKPEQLPPESQERLNQEDVYRVVCDYIAGMTDRYVQEEYRKLFDPFERV